MVDVPGWQLVHRWLVTRRLGIQLLFTAGAWTILVASGAAYFLLSTDEAWWSFFTEVARKAGTISALCYVTTMIPGMLQRFNQFPLFRSSIMLFRRQFGVTMFLLAIFHQAIMGLYPKLIFLGGFSLSMLTQHEVYGALALWFLFPLWLTSNDYSKQKLGPNWSWLHKLTYLALFFIYLHVSTVELTLRIVFIGLMILQLFSWGYYGLQLLQKRKVRVDQTS